MKKRNKKKQFTTEWVDYTEIRKTKASYYLVIGERGTGKTYGVKKIIIDKYIRNKEQFVYLRRKHSYITARKMIRLFDDIEDYAKEKIGCPIDYKVTKGFVNGSDEVLGVATSLDDVMNEKGQSFHNVTTILFDEFVDLTYDENEIEKFLNIISTIVRNRNNVEIFMLGNTLSKYCPYFDLFGINPNKIQRGKMYKFVHHLGVTATLYYTKTKIESLTQFEKKSPYLGFDNNENVKMILFGEWDNKSVETNNIDGKGWNSKRELIPLYISALQQSFELSLNMEGIPILFVRKVNTQNGMCNRKINFNLCPDKTVLLINKNGTIPLLTSQSSLLPQCINSQLNLARECVRCGRVVYTDVNVGTEFEQIIKAL